MSLILLANVIATKHVVTDFSTFSLEPAETCCEHTNKAPLNEYRKVAIHEKHYHLEWRFGHLLHVRLTFTRTFPKENLWLLSCS